MKGTKSYMDLGSIFDEIFDAAQKFNSDFHRKFNGSSNFDREPFIFNQFFDENTDFYPNYSYPPMNVFMTDDKSLVFEFALAGFDEKDINLSFQGDYMVFSAKIGDTGCWQADDRSEGFFAQENVHYFKRRLKMKDIERQKYFVPMDKYAQNNVKAVYKNGILRVTIPPKDKPDYSNDIKIDIIKEGT